MGDARASVAMIVGLGLPALLFASLGAFDLAEAVQTKASLQTAVDSAALSGAVQFRTDQSSATTERARLMADSLAQPAKALWSVQTTAQADVSAGSITVTQSAFRKSFLGSVMVPNGVSLTARATATSNSKKPLCVLALRSGGSQVLWLQGSSVLNAGSCVVQSDSDVRVETGAQLTATAVRSVGAASGSISPAPVLDAPAVADPFANLQISVPTTCSDNGGSVKSGTLSLNPGVHCGDVTAAGQAKVVLNPGEHYFVKGAVNLKEQAQITGTDVVLIFKGSVELKFKDNASLSLEGRHSGPFAGFVLITDRSYTGTLSISTDSARLLHGTIYLPQATLGLSGTNNKVADQSPWTVVVAKQLNSSESANLVINSNYSGSPVPVPSGVGPGAGVTLAR